MQLSSYCWFSETMAAAAQSDHFLVAHQQHTPLGSSKRVWQEAGTKDGQALWRYMTTTTSHHARF